MSRVSSDCQHVLSALKSSSKGRLTYDRHWKDERRTQEIINEVKTNTSAITISPKCVSNESINKSKSCPKYKVIESSTKHTISDECNESDVNDVKESSHHNPTHRCHEVMNGLDLVVYEKQRQESVCEELNKKMKSLEIEFTKCNQEFDEEYRLIRQKYALDAIKRINGFEEDYKALKDSISYNEMHLEDNSLTSCCKMKEIESKHQLLVEEQQRKQLL
ncbi:unnamed protein product [Medioppia subpectinata]|uniref:Uncharacterized protein n=1 Tax=Medioppia subpectinata TaxID=1979941 RepID=A0A7R9Q2M4_9ACAR|nr:unnamed protein product [Medioppia subpectinata]CAG2110536.1 unnamed protein product [Medioppia subpectinata]